MHKYWLSTESANQQEVFENYLSNKGLIPSIDKELKQLRG